MDFMFRTEVYEFRVHAILYCIASFDSIAHVLSLIVWCCIPLDSMIFSFGVSFIAHSLFFFSHLMARTLCSGVGWWVGSLGVGAIIYLVIWQSQQIQIRKSWKRADYNDCHSDSREQRTGLSHLEVCFLIPFQRS